MAPPPWADDAQRRFLFNHLPQYLKAHGNRDKYPLERYWKRLDKDFLALWPAEDVLELPPPDDGAEPEQLTDEQNAAVKDQLILVKKVSVSG